MVRFSQSLNDGQSQKDEKRYEDDYRFYSQPEQPQRPVYQQRPVYREDNLYEQINLMKLAMDTEDWESFIDTYNNISKTDYVINKVFKPMWWINIDGRELNG